MMATKKWTRNQKLLLGGIVVSVVLGLLVFIVNLYFQIKTLEKNMDTVIKIEPKITTIINNITKVEKEIANIHEAMHQYFANRQTEVFRKEDVGKKVKVFPHPILKESGYVVFIELKNIPEPNSVEISTESGVRGSTTTLPFRNILGHKVRGDVEDFLTGDGTFFSVRYYPNLEANLSLCTVDGMEYTGTESNTFDSDLKCGE